MKRDGLIIHAQARREKEAWCSLLGALSCNTLQGAIMPADCCLDNSATSLLSSFLGEKTCLHYICLSFFLFFSVTYKPMPE